MSVGGALRDLGRFLDECETEESVSAVELSGAEGDAVTAEVELSLSTAGGASLVDTTVDDDGRVRLAFESAPLPTADHDVDVDVAESTVDEDGTARVRLAVTRATTEESTTTETPAEPAAEPVADARDADVPPFRNPELLAEVYESCDTFAEMTDELGMDVTAETVRRYMVDYDIHQPNSYDTGDEEPSAPTADADGDAPVVIADGIGLPDDVTVDTLIETVKRANTIYEIKQDIGIEREDALEILRELNLLDLVVGRLATEAERDITRDEIVDRLREASATE